MKMGWAGFFGAGRLRAIERGMADVRETLAALTAQAPLVAEQVSALADLSQRVAALQSQAEADRQAVREISSAALVTNTLVEVQGEELVRLHTAMLRLERQLNEDAEEARKVATGLLERIERARPAR